MKGLKLTTEKYAELSTHYRRLGLLQTTEKYKDSTDLEGTTMDYREKYLTLQT